MSSNVSAASIIGASSVSILSQGRWSELLYVRKHRIIHGKTSQNHNQLVFFANAFF
jgi:hypothetical protein